MEKFASFIFRKWVSTVLVVIGLAAFGFSFKFAWDGVEAVEHSIFEEQLVEALDPDGRLLFREFLPRGGAGTPFMVHWKYGQTHDQRVGGIDGDGTRLTFEGAQGRFTVDLQLERDQVVFYRVTCSENARGEARALHEKLKDALPGVWSEFGRQRTSTG